MHFINLAKVKWYDWIWLIPFLLIIALPYSLITTAYAKFLAYCMDYKK